MVMLRPGLKVVDLGCGTGELTSRLAAALPDSTVIGLDNSPQMLEKAGLHQWPGLSFEIGDLAQLQGSWDLIFSNAALQWSEDHPKLVGRLYSQLAPGGQIAVQVPSNHNHISHRLIQETARQEPFRSVLKGFIRVSPVLPIEDYAQLLFDLGAENIIVFEKVFVHILENSDAVVEWVSGTALVPYFERLGGEKEHFLAILRKKLQNVMPTQPVLYPFKRTFFSAQKPD